MKIVDVSDVSEDDSVLVSVLEIGRHLNHPLRLWHFHALLHVLEVTVDNLGQILKRFNGNFALLWSSIIRVPFTLHHDF